MKVEKVENKRLSHFPSPEHGIFITEFKHWNLYLHPNQSYLGRCYLWARRSDALDFIDMLDEEWLEFRAIGRDIKKALMALFSPDMFNYASLGNVARHLHVHFVPRYESPRMFQDIQFVDARWGKNYAPDDNQFPLSAEILQTIVQEISHKLN